MIEHAKRDRPARYWPWLLALAFIAFFAGLDTGFKYGADEKPHTHPAADGIVTPAEIVDMLRTANRLHARRRADIEAVHVRVDRLVEGVKAMAPQMDGRSRVPALVEEAGR